MRQISWHDADDRVTHTVQSDRTANHVFVSAEAPLPKPITQNHRARHLSLVFFRSKISAAIWRHSEQRKKIAGDCFARIFFRLARSRQHTRAFLLVGETFTSFCCLPPG